jgi:DNA-binding beta-propeller fold protein YncE
MLIGEDRRGVGRVGLPTPLTPLLTYLEKGCSMTQASEDASNGGTRASMESGRMVSTPQMARNYYFTGKLLVERDFTDEQRYLVEKQLRHNAALHGAGCVAGLRVKQHPEPARRDSYVVIEPGTAIDCQGHEILVRQEEFFDVRQRLTETGVVTNDGKAHKLQILVHYQEYPTEPVPAFFENCGDGVTSQPNRVMESYDFDVLLDPPAPRKPLDTVTLTWHETLPISHVSRVLVDEADARLYVLTTVEHTSSVYAYRLDAKTPYLLTSQVLPHEATDLALSPDGTRLYVAVRQQKSVLVLDTARLGTAQALVNELPAAGSPSASVLLAVSPRDGYLYVVDVGRRTVTPWRTGINQHSDDVDDYRMRPISIGNDAHCIIASPDGRWLFVANGGDRTISVIDATRHERAPIFLRVAPIVPYALAIADTADGLKLYVADHVNRTVSILFLELRSNPPFTRLGLAYTTGAEVPLDVAVSPGGRWLYLLLADKDNKGRVLAVDAYRIEQGHEGVEADTLPIGSHPRALTLVHSRGHLYVSSHGRADEKDIGGISAVYVHEESCGDLFTQTLEGNRGCQPGEEGVVLATIEGYKFGSNLLDAQIDNLSERSILPSTELLADLLRCILANGGGKGRHGEEGPPGRDGASIEAVQATIVDCDHPGSAALHEIDEKRTLVLEIPRGCDAPVAPAVEYTSICGLNWAHRGTMPRRELEENGLLLAFNRKVRAGDINRHTFIVLIGIEEDGLIAWRELPTRQGRGSEQVRGVELAVEEGPNGTCRIEGVENPHPPANKFVNGAWFRPTRLPPGTHALRVVLKGDLIQDEHHLGVDANHLPPWLPQRPTGDGVEGGTFESWLTIDEQR